MVPAPCIPTVPVPPPAYQRALAKRRPALQLDALTLVTRLHLLALCRPAVQQAQRHCPSPLPKGPGGAPRRYSAASLLLIALLRTLWRLSPREMTDWLQAWPALAWACGLPARPDGQPWVPSPSQQWKRAAQSGLPPYEMLFVLAVREAIRRRVIGARDLIVDSAPIKAWRRADPDAQVGHAPAHHPLSFLRGYRVHTLLCRGGGLPLLFRLAPAHAHDSPFAQPLLALAVRLYGLRPRVVRLDAAYWGPTLIAWIHTVLGAVAVVPWNPKRTKNRKSLGMAAITAAELLTGMHGVDTPERRTRHEAFVEAVLAYTPVLPMYLRVVPTHARLWAQLAAGRQLIGAHDLVIAATALAYGCDFARVNLRSFARLWP